MRKLLLILLLIFPFHGAWAEKIHISCDLIIDATGSPLPSAMIYEIDTSKKVVNGEHPIHSIDDYRIK